MSLVTVSWFTCELTRYILRISHKWTDTAPTPPHLLVWFPSFICNKKQDYFNGSSVGDLFVLSWLLHSLCVFWYLNTLVNRLSFRFSHITFSSGTVCVLVYTDCMTLYTAVNYLVFFNLPEALSPTPSITAFLIWKVRNLRSTSSLDGGSPHEQEPWSFFRYTAFHARKRCWRWQGWAFPFFEHGRE